MKDAFGTEIRVGDHVIHSAQGYVHRHVMYKGVVTSMRSTGLSNRYYPPAYHYTDHRGKKRVAYDTSMTVVIR